MKGGYYDLQENDKRPILPSNKIQVFKTIS